LFDCNISIKIPFYGKKNKKMAKTTFPIAEKCIFVSARENYCSPMPGNDRKNFSSNNIISFYHNILFHLSFNCINNVIKKK